MSSASTARSLLSSIGAATFSQAWRMGLLFATNLLLRRLVDLESWGLWNWAESTFLILGALRDLGVARQVLRMNPRPYGNLLAVQAGWGALLGGAVVLAAPLLARANPSAFPEVVPVLQALALYLLFEGLATVPLIYFEAQLEIRRTLFAEVTRGVVYSGLAIALALAGWGVWSFVVAQVIATGIFALLLWLRAWRTLPLVWAPGSTMSVVRASLPLGAMWLLALAIMYLDPLVLGARFPPANVATYGMAYFAAFLATRILQPPMVRAIYPALVAYRGQPDRGFATFRLATLLLHAVEIPAALFLCVNADLVVLVLGGEQWAGSARYLQILAFAPLADPLSRFGGELLVAHHHDRPRILALALTFASMLGAGLLLTSQFGPVGMAWANFTPLGTLVIGWTLYRLWFADLRQLIRELAEIYVLPVPLFLGAWFFSGEGLSGRFALSLLAAALSAAWYWRRFGDSFVTYFRTTGEASASNPSVS